MNASVSSVTHEGLMLLASIGGPLVGGLLVVGIMVGIFQATTQINDPAIGFLPRLAVALLGCWLLGGWAIERLARYFASALQRMAEH